MLVHGAWRGGWCWRRVADRLRRDGHAVFTPTLTGLGERSHLLGPGIDLASHVADIVGVRRWERVSEVVLCGHSYGGFVISGVAEAVPALIRSIVFLDAFVPENGDTIQKLTGTAIEDAIRAALQRGDIGVPPRPAEAFGVNEADGSMIFACGSRSVLSRRRSRLAVRASASRTRPIFAPRATSIRVLIARLRRRNRIHHGIVIICPVGMT
jgi:pimeloyl-ACP methyl ester carboxylesterase